METWGSGGRADEFEVWYTLEITDHQRILPHLK